MNRLNLIALLVLPCVACTSEDTAAPSGRLSPEQEAGNDLPGPTGKDPCAAMGYRGFVGQNLAAVTMPGDLNSRVLRPGEVVTMDYIAERMTIRVDADGTITSVTCG